MSDKPSLIVTGLSGMIGNRFEELYGHKFEFHNLDLSVGVDITDAKQVAQKIESISSDVILHLAAFTDVSAAQAQEGDESGLAYKVNVVGTKNIVDVAKEQNKFLIFISTDYVFDGTKNKLYTEEDRPNPIEWYGKTKLIAEEYIKENLEHYSIIRTSSPFRSNFPQKLDIVRKIIKGLTENNLPPMFTDNFITPTFIDDLCKVFFMFTLKRPRGVWHATGSSHLSAFEVATKVKEAFSLGGTITPGSMAEYLKTDPRPRQKSLKMSNAKLQEELGNPMLPIESALMIMRTQM